MPGWRPGCGAVCCWGASTARNPANRHCTSRHDPRPLSRCPPHLEQRHDASLTPPLKDTHRQSGTSPEGHSLSMKSMSCPVCACFSLLVATLSSMISCRVLTSGLAMSTSTSGLLIWLTSPSPVTSGRYLRGQNHRKSRTEGRTWRPACVDRKQTKRVYTVSPERAAGRETNRRGRDVKQSLISI